MRGLLGEQPVRAKWRTKRLNPHVTTSAEIEPVPHWGKASAFTTRPTLPPAKCTNAPTALPELVMHVLLITWNPTSFSLSVYESVSVLLLYVLYLHFRNIKVVYESEIDCLQLIDARGTRWLLGGFSDRTCRWWVVRSCLLRVKLHMGMFCLLGRIKDSWW